MLCNSGKCDILHQGFNNRKWEVLETVEFEKDVGSLSSRA